jgi:hypothetical protein
MDRADFPRTTELSQGTNVYGQVPKLTCDAPRSFAISQWTLHAATASMFVDIWVQGNKLHNRPTQRRLSLTLTHR